MHNKKLITTFSHAHIKMDNLVLLYTVAFIAYCVLEVTGALPQEIISAGLSLPSLFKKYYGDEEVDFVFYHIKRTTVTILIHSCLPLCYVIGLQAVYPHFNILFFWQAEPTIFRLMIISLSILSFGIVTAVLFVKSDFKYHPFARILSKYEQEWRSLASVINSEFRSIDKFISINGRRRLIVTDNWIIYCGVHTFNIVKQSDVTIHIKQSEEHRVDTEAGRIQYLIIKISSNGIHRTSFDVRLRSEEYSQMRLIISSPVHIARQIVLQQSLDDRFLRAFTEQVSINGVYRMSNTTEPLEPCFGCSQKLPEVKLTKTCSSSQEGECRSCDCKPMWCLACMSKWFASRQDQNQPDTWMTSRATCPLCRKTFCMLDIMSIEQ